MKKVCFIIIILCSGFVIFAPRYLFAQSDSRSYSLETYYPTADGTFKSISANVLTITPQAQKSAGDCRNITGDSTLGTIYFNQDGQVINYCEGSGDWREMGESVWEQDDTSPRYVYLNSLAYDEEYTGVGLGTSSSSFGLTVGEISDSEELEYDGSIIAFGKEGFGDSLGGIGDTTSFIWYPKMAAFRAGRSGSNNAWDDDAKGSANVGAYSTAFGNATRASNDATFAAGSGTQATGAQSVTFGKGTIAKGNNSIAFGRNTYAGSFGEVALGVCNPQVDGDIDSFEIGEDSEAGDNLFVIGNGLIDETGTGCADDQQSNAVKLSKRGYFGIKTRTEEGISSVSDSADFPRPQGVLHIVHDKRLFSVLSSSYYVPTLLVDDLEAGFDGDEVPEVFFFGNAGSTNYFKIDSEETTSPSDFSRLNISATDTSTENPAKIMTFAYVDASNRVGINNDEPGHTLHVTGNILAKSSGGDASDIKVGGVLRTEPSVVGLECNEDTEGSIFFDSTATVFKGCTGTKWEILKTESKAF